MTTKHAADDRAGRSSGSREVERRVLLSVPAVGLLVVGAWALV